MSDNTISINLQNSNNENKNLDLIIQDLHKLSTSLKSYINDVGNSIKISDNLKEKIDEWRKLNNSILQKIKK
jgi:hypothetical protein